MTKFTQVDYEKAIEAIWESYHKEQNQEERNRLRHLGRQLEKKKAVAFAEMLLNDQDGAQ